MGAVDSGPEASDLTPIPRVAVAGRMIVWDGGVPVLSSAPVLEKSQIEGLAPKALSLPYRDLIGLEPEFEGMSNVEVMYIKMAREAADGDRASRKDILDRAIGKPKTSAEVKNFNLTYEDLIKDIAAKENAAPIRNAISAELIPDNITDLFG